MEPAHHERSKAGGRRQHLKQCSYPSGDHYHGPRKLNYRICSGVTNLAKGAMDHRRFVALCRKVAAAHEGWGIKEIEAKAKSKAA